MEIATGAERCTQPKLIQPGDCKWMTVIQSICAAGSCTLPLIFYKEYVYIFAWYEEAEIRKILVPENGWTNNAPGLE
jgi:hypothetical protein